MVRRVHLSSETYLPSLVQVAFRTLDEFDVELHWQFDFTLRPGSMADVRAVFGDTFHLPEQS